MVDFKKCAVIGCGFVGATSAYTLMESALFTEMVLIDANTSKAEGEAMDISDGLPFNAPMKIYPGSYADLVNCALIIIAAGTNQRQGETRLDLLSRNAAIMRDIVRQIVVYNTEAVLLVVTNPVDILTSVVLEESGFPSGRVIGSGTVLDTARLKYVLGRHLQVDARNVHAFVIGEHGDSELAVWSSANISGIDLNAFCSVCGKCSGMENMYKAFEDVRNAAYRIIERKGATYYAIAQSVKRIAESIVRDEDSVLTVSTLCTGHYGLDGVCIGVPSIIGREGVKKVLDIPLSKEESEKLRSSANNLKIAAKQLAGRV